MNGVNKRKKIYSYPQTSVAEIDLEGLVCTSVYKKVQVDQLHNMNDPNHLDEGAQLEPFYFES